MEGNTLPYNSESLISRRNEAFYYLGFLVWPFGVLLAGLKHWDRPWTKNVFWLFCIFFGYTFIIAKDSIGSADSARYAQILTEYSHSSMSFGVLWKSFYSQGSSYIDIAQPILTYAVSCFTENPHILFAVFALIFGYFHSRNIWCVLEGTKGNITFFNLFFLLSFILLNPIWSINGFRMWTAAQIFLYGTLPYLLYGNSRRLVWSGVSMLFHFSFLLPITILLIFILLKNRLTIYLTFFIFTSFIKEIDLQSIHSYLSFLPAVFQSRLSGYTNVDYAESLSTASQALNWYLPLASKGLAWITYILTLFIYFFCRKFLKNRQELMNMFCFSLLFYSFANVFSLVPSGGRFLNVASTFMFAFFILFISKSPKMEGLGFIKIISIPLLTLFCIVMLRSGMDYMSLDTIIGNPIFATLETISGSSHNGN